MFPRMPAGWANRGDLLSKCGPRKTGAVIVMLAVVCWAGRRAYRTCGWGLLESGKDSAKRGTAKGDSSAQRREYAATTCASQSESTPSTFPSSGDRAKQGSPRNAAGVPASEWEHLTEEERRAWRQLREEQKMQSKIRLRAALNTSSPQQWEGAGLEIVFDLSYGASSTDQMNRSLAKQLAYAYSYAKNLKDDAEVPAMHITSYRDEAKVALEKRGAGSWLMHKHDAPLRQVFENRLDDLIYLSPDGPQTLEALIPGKVYVIGGIVDRTVSKNISLMEACGERAGGVRIPAMRLPIDENIPRSFQGRGHVLNINTVAHILMAYHQRRNWEEAIVAAMYAEAPARFRESIQQERRALVDGNRPPPNIPSDS